MIITTSQKASSEVKAETKELANSLDLIYKERHKKPISELLLEDMPVAVVSKNQLTIHFNEEQEHRFHLSMAQLRILRLQRGDDDHLVNAIELLTTESSNSISIVDCTLGLGSDSIIMSYAFPNAHIIGLEASYPIWLSTWFGLKHYTHEDMTVTNALRRIDARHDNFESFLQGLPNDSVDILYFDPMFEVPIEESPQFKPLRGHTSEGRITDSVIQDARRVCRLGFIIKERPFSSVFKDFPPSKWVGGKYSRIGYGVYSNKGLQ